MDLGPKPIDSMDIRSRAYASEMISMSLFVRWGYDVLQPFTPTEYDFVVYKNGTYKRVQVKSTDRGMFKLVQSGNKKPYDDTSFDYLCAVEMPFVWVIPWSFVQNKTSVSSKVLEKKFLEYRFNLTDPKTYNPI